MAEEQLEQQNAVADADLGLTEQAATDAGGDSNAQAAPAMIDIDGEQVSLDQVKSWKSGHMMNEDYTRKTQELAEQRKQLEPLQSWSQYLQANPEKAQKVYETLAQLEGQSIDPRDQKVQQLESTVHHMILENSKREADTRINRIKSDEKYQGMFNDPKMEELLLAKALQVKDFDLKRTADEIHEVISKVKTSTHLETEKKVQERVAAQTRQASIGKINTMDAGSGFNPRTASRRELDQKALEMLT